MGETKKNTEAHTNQMDQHNNNNNNKKCMGKKILD